MGLDVLKLLLAVTIPAVPGFAGFSIALAPGAAVVVDAAVDAAEVGPEAGLDDNRAIDAATEPDAELPVMANDDPLDDAVVAPPEPVEGCEDTLTAAGVRFTSSRIPVHMNKGGAFQCGAEQVVRYSRGPGKIRWRGSPKVSCGMALALARFEGAIQAEAEAHFGVRVAKVVHMGTYNCREMAAYPGWVSEHSYANALDIKTFVLTNGREVTVRHGWNVPKRRGKASRRAAQDAAFLRAVARRAFDEDHFSVVLTPEFDAAHRGHFHLDLARYRVDGTQPDTE